MTLFPFDEINALAGEAEGLKQTDTEPEKGRTDKYIDEVTDLFVMAYVYGTAEVAGELGEALAPDMAQMQAAVEKKFDGKDYKDRIRDYLKEGTAADIKRVVETDAHRIYNTAKYDGAVRGGATMKTWGTMLDDRVRDTHEYLEGVTIPIEAEFYSFRGGSTLYPGQWGIPEEDCNCRCYLTFSKA